MNRPKSASSKDVAREVGVSQATVSYVLNNVPGIRIKPETRQAVIEAARRLNYHPNLIARSMRLQKSMSIGVVSDKNISNFWFMKSLEGIRDSLADKNYSITLCINKSQEIENAEHINYYSSNRIDGIIFAFADLSDEHVAYMLDNNIPFVVIHSNANNELIRAVKTDMTNAMADAAKHLAVRGFDRIFYLGTGRGDKWDRRFHEYMKALENSGLKYNDDLIVKCNSDSEPNVVFDKFFKNVSFPCAVMAESNNLAFQLLKYAAGKGIMVPEQLSVTAIGTSRFAEMSFPSLSSVEAPLYEMGCKGVEMLFDIMKGNLVNEVVTLEWKFMLRKSSEECVLISNYDS